MENGTVPVEYPKTIVLPFSGRMATVLRRLTVRDTRIGGRGLPADADPVLRTCSMLSQVVLLDNQPQTMEDFDSWDFEDFTAVVSELGLGTGKNESPTAPVLPASSNGALQPPN